MEESFLMQSIGNALYWTKAIFPIDPNVDKYILENGELLLQVYIQSALLSGFNWDKDYSIYGKDQNEAFDNLREFLSWTSGMCKLKNLDNFVEYNKLRMAIISTGIELWEKEKITKEQLEKVKSYFFEE